MDQNARINVPALVLFIIAVALALVAAPVLCYQGMWILGILALVVGGNIFVMLFIHGATRASNALDETADRRVQA